LIWAAARNDLFLENVESLNGAMLANNNNAVGCNEIFSQHVGGIGGSGITSIVAAPIYSGDTALGLPE